MTKANITQYSATASSNTDINDINIAENCPASGLNNAIRELMAHLKNVDTGTQALTALSVTGAVDFNGDLDVDGTTNLDVVDIDGTLNVQGETTLQTHLNMGDDDKIKLGASGDLEIYHDGSNSYIDDTGTGGLLIRVDDALYIRSTGNENMIFAQKDGQVRLYHDNSQKLNTSSSGVTVTGAITASSGDVTLTDGNLVVASGHGIDFSATSNSGGSMSSEILSDYEEGSWTPTLPNGGTIGGTFGTSYTKVGDTVTVRGYLNNISIPNDSNEFRIGGLPYAVKSGNYYGGLGAIQYVSNKDIDAFGMGDPVPFTGNSVIYFHRRNGTTATVLNSNATGMTALIFGVSYQV